MPTTYVSPLTDKPRPFSPRILILGTGLLVLALLGINAAFIWHLHERELQSEGRELEHLSLIIAEQAKATFQAADLVISSVAAEMAGDGVIDAASFDQKMSEHDVHLLLRQKMSGLPQLDALIIVNREGTVSNFSRSWPIPAIDISDREYFQAMKNDPALKSYISNPIRNRTTDTWTIYMARRVSGPRGEFLGLILGALQTRYFNDFYRAASKDEGTIALQRLDGKLLVRYPQTDAIGKDLSSSSRLLGSNASATVREQSPIDGLMRIKSAHLVEGYPLFVLATLTEEVALADWRSLARLMALSALASALAIVLACFAFARQLKQQVSLADARADLLRHEDRAVAMATAANVALETTKQLTYSAMHDALTGLPNRLLLNDRIGQAITMAERHQKGVAILFLDLDGFKHINDSLGHSIGDKLLQSIAKRLEACVRASDTVGRQGGDEFIVLLSEVEHPEHTNIALRKIVQAVSGIHSIGQHDLRVHVATAAKRMLEGVAEPHSIDHHDLYVTASIGVSIYPDDGLDAETLIQNADTAMYQAKESGHHSYQFFRSEMNANAVERQSVEEGLRRALERKEFTLHYQPIVDLSTDAIIGAEALIRWRHPSRGMVPPGRFIPIAEDCGLMLSIGKWVLKEACRQTQSWIEAGLPIATIAVNMSALEFRSESCLEDVFATLSETGLDPKYLELELTESSLMKRPEDAASTLKALRERGVRVAIDDFGTGFSSLGYLRRFPLDTLKVDQSFVRQIGTVGGDAAIVTAVIGMAHSLNLRVIAEGVEVLEELEFLRGLQCDEVQGYYFSRPVPAAEFAILLADGLPNTHRTNHRLTSESQAKAPAIR